jgi:SAM-dependent methyltransferase
MSERSAARWDAKSFSAVTLKANPVAKLQLGAGGNQLAGWLNTDQSRTGPYLDLTEPFPFSDNSFAYIICEHAIEHICYADALAMLRECIRVLKPGGKLRISTPDLVRYADMIVRRDEETVRRSIDWYFRTWVMPGHGSAQFYKPLSAHPNPAFVVNDAFRNYGHQFIYDFDTLTEALANVGFREIYRAAVGVSEDENLRGVDTRVAAEEAYLSLGPVLN